MTDAATPEPASTPEIGPPLDLPDAVRAIDHLIAEEHGPGEDRPGEEAAEATEEDANSGEAETRAEEESEQPLYRVKVGGETQEVTLAELVRGYQRGADYTRKTMRLAEERRALRQEQERAEQERTAAEAERRAHAQELGALVPYLRRQMQTQFAGIDWARLATEDPDRFNRLKPVHDALAVELGQAEAAQMEIGRQEQQRLVELQRANQQYLAEQARALADRVPEFADPIKGPREKAALRAYLLEAGYGEEELSRLTDHRDVILARKAMLHDRMTASKDKVARQVAALPRVQSPGTAAERGAGREERRTALMKRLRSTGRTEDAARLIEDLI